MKRLRIDQKFIDVNPLRSIIIYSLLVPYCIYLCIDNFLHGVYTIGLLALFCAVMTAIALILLSICRFGRKPRKLLMHIAIHIQCIVYWFTFGWFLYTGGTGGTSIFLIFAAAPVCMYFFNLFYGSYFCTVLFIGMAVYMYTPLHLKGYQFPEMYYKRLPVMYLIEVIMCAVAQYEAVKAKIKQDIALEEARRASEAKTDFLANTSHEIRTPINAVLGMNEMILRESAKAEKIPDNDPEAMRQAFKNIEEYAGNVDSAGNNLLSIINDILDFTKIEEGRMDVIEEEYQLSTLLNDVIKMIRFKALEKNLIFDTDIDENLPDRLWGDEVRVRQVITNLLTNAVKYTDTGKVTLTAKGDVSEQAVDGHRLIRLFISVKDTGIGIKQEDIGRIFDKFERMDLEKNSTIEGTGLGLAITGNLLKMMGGEIKVQSVYGQGSEFSVMIPQRVISDEPIGDLNGGSEKSHENKKIYHEAYRAPDADILIVDDTRMNLIVAKEFLKDIRVRIETASGGAEAVSMAGSKKYDVIFMDQRMPGMDGIEAMHCIKKQADGPNTHTPVICLTADAVIGAKERYLSQGFDDYLTKPINSATLERMLKKYLPEDKVIPVQEGTFDEGSESETTTAADEQYENGFFESLKEANIDVRKGMANCGMDERFYRSILAEFLRSSYENMGKINELVQKSKIKDYAVLIHALKSTSATIGAVRLSALSASLEKAAKAGNEQFILDRHKQAMEEYDKVILVLEKTVSDETGIDGQTVNEDGSMEFAPQGDPYEEELYRGDL